MGMVSIGKLLIVALIFALVFGTKKLRTLGSDLGESIKGFKKAMSDDNSSTSQKNDADFDVKTITEQKESTQQSVSSEQQDNQPKK